MGLRVDARRVEVLVHEKGGGRALDRCEHLVALEFEIGVARVRRSTKPEPTKDALG